MTCFLVSGTLNGTVQSCLNVFVVLTAPKSCQHIGTFGSGQPPSDLVGFKPCRVRAFQGFFIFTPLGGNVRFLQDFQGRLKDGCHGIESDTSVILCFHLGNRKALILLDMPKPPTSVRAWHFG